MKISILFDVLPASGYVQAIFQLAVRLIEQGYEVAFTNISDTVLWPGCLRERGIHSVEYPDDLRWFKPDLVLLDCQLRKRESFYKQKGLPVIYISTQILDAEAGKKENDGVIHLPLSKFATLSSRPSPRQAPLEKMLSGLPERQSQVVIVAVMEDKPILKVLNRFYNALRKCCVKHENYHLILLTNNDKVLKVFFPLAPNISVFRMLDLPSLLPFCDIVLTTGEQNILMECVHACLPTLVYPVSDLKEQQQNALRFVELGLGRYGEIGKITPDILEEQITRLLSERELIKDRIRQMCDILGSECLEMGRIVSQLGELAKQKNRD